jgi:hypothetical protein
MCDVTSAVAEFMVSTVNVLLPMPSVMMYDVTSVVAWQNAW